MCSSSDTSSEESSTDEEDCTMEELERKQLHPYRLHPEMWYNDSGEVDFKYFIIFVLLPLTVACEPCRLDQFNYRFWILYKAWILCAFFITAKVCMMKYHWNIHDIVNLLLCWIVTGHMLLTDEWWSSVPLQCQSKKVWYPPWNLCRRDSSCEMQCRHQQCWQAVSLPHHHLSPYKFPGEFTYFIVIVNVLCPACLGCGYVCAMLCNSWAH